MTHDELMDVQLLIGLLAMPSTQFGHSYMDMCFLAIVKYGEPSDVMLIAQKVYGNRAAEMVEATKSRPDFAPVVEVL